MICTACSTRTRLPTRGGRRPTNSKGRRIRDPARPVASSRPPEPQLGAGGPGAAARSAAALSTPGMGDSLGGESPLEEEVVLTPSRRQLRCREAGWEGSPRRNPAPRNTNRV
jgi:hypothetical protein